MIGSRTGKNGKRPLPGEHLEPAPPPALLVEFVIPNDRHVLEPVAPDEAIPRPLVTGPEPRLLGCGDEQQVREEEERPHSWRAGVRDL